MDDELRSDETDEDGGDGTSHPSADTDPDRKTVPSDGEEQKSGRRKIDMSILVFIVLTTVAGFANWWLDGPDAVTEGAREAAWSVIGVVPQFALGVMVASMAQVAIPRHHVARALGEKSGFRGLALAALMGTVMPGGPFASFPIVLGLAQAGADVGALVCFVTAWATMGLNRLLIWEIPFMGFDFGVLRFLSSLPLPFIAGLMARQIAQSYPSLRRPKE